MNFAEEVKLVRGTFWLVVSGIVIFNFIFLFAGLMWFGSSTQPELNAIQIKETREDLKLMNEKLDEIQKMMADQAVKDAEIKGRDFGYRVGRADKTEKKEGGH